MNPLNPLQIFPADESNERSHTDDEIENFLKITKCPHCNGDGFVIYPGDKQYVTRDMAYDAGDLSLEGSFYRESEPVIEQCPYCNKQD
jgi:hypothetical protein